MTAADKPSPGVHATRAPCSVAHAATSSSSHTTRTGRGAAAAITLRGELAGERLAGACIEHRRESQLRGTKRLHRDEHGLVPGGV